MVTGLDGIAVFDALHRRGTVTEAMPYAFDLLELNGEDFRALSLVERKAKLERLLAREPLGIAYNEHTEEDGAAVFRHACAMGLEGIVSKRLAAPYRSGPSRDWLKIKNPASPAMRRAPRGVVVMMDERCGSGLASPDRGKAFSDTDDLRPGPLAAFRRRHLVPIENGGGLLRR